MEEKNPNIFQHEIAIISDDDVEPFPLIAVTNLDQAKTLHIGKGEIVGFARLELKSVTYVATTNEINIEEYRDMSPRNWILKGQRKPLRSDEDSEKAIYRYNPTQESEFIIDASEKCEKLLNQLDLKENSGSECGRNDKKNDRWDENTKFDRDRQPME